MNAPSFVMPSPQAAEVLGANAARISKAFAQGVRPPAKISVSEWALKHRKFPEDSAYPGAWSHETAPYLVEIMDKLSPHDPCSEINILKCAQSGGSASGENWIGYISDVAPGPLMYVQATITAAKDWVAEKFWPMVEASPRLDPEKRGTIMPKRARGGGGSTGNRVRFARGGWMLIAGANSAATLRQHSIRYAIEDDLDQFPDNLDNQGSPEGMVTARLRTYTRQGLSKRLGISTGTNKGASKIGARYAKSDRRRYYLKCRHCGSRFDPIFEDLRWPDGRPDLVELVTPCCGVSIKHWEKAQMSMIDGWVPTVELDGQKPPRVMAEQEMAFWRSRDLQGRQPGYHITGIITAFMTWAQLCVAFVAAQGDVNKLRVWTNLDMGDEFVLKGDAPPAESLEVLREQDWGKGQVPWGPCVFTLGADIQGDGIYYEALGWGAGLENWSLDHGFLPGATDVAGEGAWARLEEVATRKFTLPGGRQYGFDQICVDAGYHTEAAKAFCRRSAKRLPVFGRDGWTLPILGRGQAIAFEVGKNNRRKRRKQAGDDAYLVGTFGAKFSFYGHLRTSIAAAEEAAKGGRPEPFRGRIHFGRDAGADYFDMLTSESVVTETKNGQARRVWRKEAGRENHWLDCRVYNRAAAEAMALDSRSDAEWLALQADRYASVDPLQGDLIALANRPVPDTAFPSAAPEPAAASSSRAAADPIPDEPAVAADSWIDTSGWSL
ncbi:phage terminase large subunit family protein [Caulobacter sp. UNC279MFTsu5.1]|uniref:phage terminase large subunit family protein n=1 Tax=Caulobacter sp. UNC279MFTsu5.1 TaxID=1502775 RepID=UPI00036704FA|nr:terminase gpA endonuclease subunit [Caulobacter sp. UNC279MFTsu5.1]SFK41853.1 Phage terminase, large subunit GpA [Caulobacter sp. UNC279MFTsu5.1]